MTLIERLTGSVAQTWAAFNGAVKFLTYKNPATGQPGKQGWCVVCHMPVAWYRPVGSAVWCGLVSAQDATQLLEDNTSGVPRIIATALKPGTTLHDCGVKDANGNTMTAKYGQRFADALNGVFPQGQPALVRPTGSKQNRFRRPRATSAPAPALPAPAVVPAVSTAPAAVTTPDFDAVSIPDPDAALPQVPTQRGQMPDPALPPDGIQQWKRAASAVMHRIRRILLFGPPGTGKTSFPFRLCQQTGDECFITLPLSEEMDSGYLLGQFVLKPTPAGGTEVKWLDGIAVRAARMSHTKPVWLVLDEISHCSSDMMTFLLGVLNNPDMIQFALPTGEIVKPNPDNWNVVATTNDEPAALPEPIRSRLAVQILIGYPNPGIIAALHTREAKQLLTSASREYDIRHVQEWDRLVANGVAEAEAANIIWPPTIAQSFIDGLRNARS